MKRRRSAKQARGTAESLHRQDLPPCRYFLSTGSTLLDLAISDRYPGGVGSGRTTQIIGDHSTAKTVIVKEILGAAQRLGGYAVEEDAEYTPDFLRAELFGLHVGKWADEAVQAEARNMPIYEAVRIEKDYCYRNPESIEAVFDEEIGPLCQLVEGRLGEGAKAKQVEPLPKPLAIGVDTFTALPSRTEKGEALDERSYRAERAKRMSAGFRKWLAPMARNDVALIAVDHIRDNIGVMFGPKWTTSGGKALQQYASTRIFLAQAGDLKNRAGRTVGVKIKAKVVKNKIAPPGRETFFYVLFDYGIDDIRGNLEWLAEQAQAGIETALGKSGAWWSWRGEKLGQGIEGAIEAVERAGLEKELEAEVARVWQVVYEGPGRARKRRHGQEAQEEV